MVEQSAVNRCVVGSIPAIPVVDYCKVSSFFLINSDCVFGYFGFEALLILSRSSPKFLASRDGCFYYAIKVVSRMSEKVQYLRRVARAGRLAKDRGMGERWLDG